MSTLDPSIPVGGTTGACHESTAAIEAAAGWLIFEPDTRGRAIVPELKCRFGLTTAEACEAIGQAAWYRRTAA